MKKLLCACMALFMCFGLAACGSSDDKKNEDEKTNEKEEKKDNQEEQKEEKKEEKVYKIGDTQKVGKVEYTVISKDVTDYIGNEFLGTNAQNEFMVITVEITNHGDEALTVSDSFFNLKDGSKTFKTDSGNAIYLEDDSIIFKEINPDASLTGKVLFDISEKTVKSSDLQLQVQTGAWGTEKGYFKLN